MLICKGSNIVRFQINCTCLTYNFPIRTKSYGRTITHCLRAADQIPALVEFKIKLTCFFYAFPIRKDMLTKIIIGKIIRLRSLNRKLISRTPVVVPLTTDIFPISVHIGGTRTPVIVPGVPISNHIAISRKIRRLLTTPREFFFRDVNSFLTHKKIVHNQFR